MAKIISLLTFLTVMPITPTVLFIITLYQGT